MVRFLEVEGKKSLTQRRKAAKKDKSKNSRPEEPGAEPKPLPFPSAFFFAPWPLCVRFF
jgi:hypothetical protein